MREQPIITEIKGEFKYSVFFDDYVDFDFDFENEQDKQDYIEKFNKGLMASFYVLKEKICNCCHSWSFQDALSSIHEESAEKALKYYQEYCEA